MPHRFSFFAPCPKGLETLLKDELHATGIAAAKETRAGVAFDGDLPDAYRVCLWSRLASRVLMPIARFAAPTPEALYDGVRAVAWRDHVSRQGTLAVDATTVESSLTHSHFAALKVKDAIVDQFRDATGGRPSVDVEHPDVRVNLFLRRDEATVSIDLSGEALHRRGYRQAAGEAPLKENLAAAILHRAEWSRIAARGGALVDPLCGSGTLLIEGAMMAGDVAPGLMRRAFGFSKWRGHEAASWAKLLDEARARREAARGGIPLVRGYDHDDRAVAAALENARRAGLADVVSVQMRPLTASAREVGAPGLVVTNPPYGERMGDAAEMPALYRELGVALRRDFVGWRVAVLTGNADFGKVMGLRASRMHTLWNGAIECRLLHFEIDEKSFVRERTKPVSLSPGGQSFANRLQKDLKHFGRWAKRNAVSCYRAYDADIPEYNVAVDLYEAADGVFAHVQEYAAPDEINPIVARNRLREATRVVTEALAVPAAHVVVKVRRRQRAGAQYNKVASTGVFYEVREGDARFLVNLTDYLDTGIFLDHRETRAMIRSLAKGRHFLNLFGYTGTATVHAALGGASSTTTVDLSNTYVDWAARNFALNGLPRGGGHELISADVTKWLLANDRRRFDLIFLDPPTFSRSKRMTETLDVQRDHADLIVSAASLLAPDGILIFSTNNRRFKIDAAALPGLDVNDITRATIPKDFERNPRIHQCFRILRK
ncbi:MAG: bifunctional 23S rRNA (guanine(2069)-N(7))-methyltransferase RlmK/23S rRNA (guanine(2445)-N(2))-methyltransferase RlmL [Deltaproteobacteria bacterium]|nr:bifunctional 23S rRNA (guanine(2069)-N(7))-methyltransferase RlmK/23S rRNA (guanine(2445)-N(2))-methyltransferase RlmL [Deltaproteobacteria bacterium]